MIKKRVWTCECGTQVVGGNECPDCHTIKPDPRGKTGPTSGSSLRHFCMCGSKLTTDSKCQETGLYPRMLQAKNDDGQWMFSPFHCPFVCPVCRERLDWDGGCRACHGTKTGRREDWNFPGDRYVRVDDGSHWGLDAGPQGPRMACTLEQNKAGITAVQAILQRKAIPTSVRAILDEMGWKPPLGWKPPEDKPLTVTKDEW